MLIASSQRILVQQRLFEKHSHMASSEGQVTLNVNILNVYNVQDVFTKPSNYKILFIVITKWFKTQTSLF